MRDFLYLDVRQVDQYLAQVEDGLYDDQSEQQSSGRDRKAGAKLKGGPLEVGGDIGSNSADEISRTRRQTPESRFNRLYPHLGTVEIDELTQSVFSTVNRGQVLEVDCAVDIPTFARTLANSSELTGMAELMRTFGETVDDETTRMMEGITTLAQRSDGSIVATGEIGSEEPIFVFKLARESLRVALDDLEGDATVIGTVQRTWPATETYPVLTIPGLNILSRKERREMERNTSDEDDDAPVIKGPGVTLNVVAIFR